MVVDVVASGIAPITKQPLIPITGSSVPSELGQVIFFIMDLDLFITYVYYNIIFYLFLGKYNILFILSNFLIVFSKFFSPPVNELLKR